MSDRLSTITARIEGMHQLSSVITAMRGIAAARLREADLQLEAMKAYAGTIEKAIARALAFIPLDGQPASVREDRQKQVVIALCTEQGFAGSFNTHVLKAVRELSGEPHDLLLVGDRGRMLAGEMGLTVHWSIPMAAHAKEVENIANRLMDALYARLRPDGSTMAIVVHAQPDGSLAGPICQKRLLPFDYSRFAAEQLNQPPLITLPPQKLLGLLAEEYIFAELCQTLSLSFAAENDARMRTMVAARSNVAKKLEELSSRAHLLRQEQITSEVTELAAGVSAGKQKRRRSRAR